MQKKLMFKVLMIGVLSILLLIPLGMIKEQIAARSVRQAAVIRDIAESAAGAQTIVGPIIAVHYRERVERRVMEPGTGRETVTQDIVERTALFPAQRLEIAGDLRVDTLKRGLYRARVYHLAAQVSGNAAIPPNLGLGTANVIEARANLVLGIADPRGFEDDPEVQVNGTAHRLGPGTDGSLKGPGAHVPLGDFDPATGISYEFALPLNVMGIEQLAIAPTADTTHVQLKSSWPHPSFQGRFLPQTRTVSEDGFEATWQVSHLARDFERTIEAADKSGNRETLGISLIDPVNVYLKAERGVKYGVLFIALTFAAFFLTEVLRQLPIHPMQYLLVGLALAIFFLLLIALSEHFDFLVAYLVSSIACVALIGTYLAGVLRNGWRGLVFGSGIAALYGVLYGVLLSEDNALLMGAVLLFLALTATMLTTRGLDWNRVATFAAE